MGRLTLRSLIVFAMLAVAAGAVGIMPATASPPASYEHVFVIVEENHGYTDVIPNPAAPNLNALAQQYGLATDYFGVSHPSEPNYVALLGGSTFNVNSDNPYWTQTVNAPDLVSELDQAGVSWKAYLDGVPHAGYKGICYPIKCNGTPDIDPLFVSKHDAIQNFTTSRTAADWAAQVPIAQLATDLAAGSVPRFGYVIPSECLDMHGDPPYCVDGGNPFDPQDQHLVSQGDAYLGQLISTITTAKFWAHGNNAIAIIFDEGDDNGGFGNVAGGQVASIVVTSHGPRGVQDPTPYSHYSLLRTLQDNFGVGCLQNSCSATPMSPLLAVTGSAAQAFAPVAQSIWPTPTPTPVERERKTILTPSEGGWNVVKSPLLGTSDNSLGAVAASSPTDIWAVGNFVPDAASPNQDATLSLANHFDGKSWSAVSTPNSGPNYNTLFGVAASRGLAWAVGVTMSSDFRARALIESWDGVRWTIADTPQPGSQRNILFGASATSSSDVWAVGDAQGADGRFSTLVEHFDGRSWSLSGSQNPGDAGDSFYGVDATAPNDVWAVGQQLTSTGTDSALIEHWDGSAWTVMSTPATGGFAAALYGVSGSGDGLVAVGETDSLDGGSGPLIERMRGGAWQVATLPALNGPQFGALWGVASSAGTVWAVGSNLDAASGDMHPAVYTSVGGGPFSFVQTPNLQAGGDTILGGATLAGDTWWAVGLYGSNAHLTLIENHTQA